MDSFWERYLSFAQQKKWRVPEEHKPIVDEAFRLHDHFAEQDLAQHQRLQKIRPKTIASVLERLVTAGLIRKIFFGEGRIYYEHVYGHMHHDHLVCLRCGKIQEFRDEVIETQQAKVCQEQGYKMVKHSLHILGLCPDCRLKEGRSMAEFGREESPLVTAGAVPLSAVPNQHQAQVVDVTGGMAVKRRLREMGIMPGTVLEIISNQFAGPFILRVKGARLAIGHNITHKVLARDLGRKST